MDQGRCLHQGRRGLPQDTGHINRLVGFKVRLGAGIARLHAGPGQDIHSVTAEDQPVPGIDPAGDRYVPAQGHDLYFVRVGNELIIHFGQVAHGAVHHHVVIGGNNDPAIRAGVDGAAGEPYRGAAHDGIGSLCKLVAFGVNKIAVLVDQVAGIVDEIAVLIQ